MIRDTLIGKSPEERAQIKSSALEKIGFKKAHSLASFDVEIVGKVDDIGGGISLYVKAWRKDGKHVGFGKDGDVEIERIRIMNPPLLVDDPDGDVIVPWRKRVGRNQFEMREWRFREDPEEALRQALEDIIRSIARDDRNIVSGRKGNTVTSVFSNTGGDGEIYSVTASNWASAHDAASGTNDAAGTTGWAYSEYYGTGDYCAIARMALPFDTSGITDTDVVSAADLVVYAADKGDNDNDAQGYIRVVQSTQASNTALADADFDQIGSVDNPTAGASDKDITGVTTGATTTFALNATGIGWIVLTGYTKLGLREGHDAEDIESVDFEGLQIRTANFTGTASDPKLTITHAAPAGTAVKTVLGLAEASVKTKLGLANASVKTFQGLA